MIVCLEYMFLRMYVWAEMQIESNSIMRFSKNANACMHMYAWMAQDEDKLQTQLLH